MPFEYLLTLDLNSSQFAVEHFDLLLQASASSVDVWKHFPGGCPIFSTVNCRRGEGVTRWFAYDGRCRLVTGQAASMSAVSRAVSSVGWAVQRSRVSVGNWRRWTVVEVVIWTILQIKKIEYQSTHLVKCDTALHARALHVMSIALSTKHLCLHNTPNANAKNGMSDILYTVSIQRLNNFTRLLIEKDRAIEAHTTEGLEYG